MAYPLHDMPSKSGGACVMDYSLVEQPNWKTFCEYISRSMRGRRVEIETESLDCRERLNKSTIRMQGLQYDEKNDRLEILLENNDLHVIAEPRYIVMGEEPISIGSISILDSTNHLQIIVFKNSLLLAAQPGQVARVDGNHALPL